MLKKSSVIASAVVPLFSLVAVLIYGIVPSSDIANSIEYSGKAALSVIAISPLFALFALINFFVIYRMERNYWYGIYKKGFVNIISAVMALCLIFSFASSAAFTVFTFDLGFVAPFDDTVYESLYKVMLFICALCIAAYTAKVVLFFRKQK